MTYRSDLAIEASELTRQPEGVQVQERTESGLKITDIRVQTEEGGKKIGKPVGRYLTIEMKNVTPGADELLEQSQVISVCLASMLPKEGDVMVVGLGNRDITPDALGPRAAERVIATRHLPDDVPGIGKTRGVTSVVPGVMGTTGIESADFIKALHKETYPAAILVIDALASRRLARLASTIQIADCGINPGSGVGNNRMEISQKTMGVPVIALGVPMVVDGTTLACDLLGMEEGTGDRTQAENKMGSQGREFMVTPREVDQMVSDLSRLVALSVNRALQPAIPAETLLELMQ